ncbi:MAG: alpha/beta hydrolase [Acidobacteriota bacterium]|jgi:predicted peptidase|nr:alpha/beta hydrolase [Acidobacteriota bacterium]
MRNSRRTNGKLPALTFLSFMLMALLGTECLLAQAPKMDRGPMPKMPMQIKPDPRVQQRKYRFEATNEDLAYVLYVSSKVTKDKKSPLIVALHGMGGDGNFLVRDRLVDLAEEGGYIVVGPLGYNVSGWYGSPVIAMGGRPVEPPNLAELSEKDVMTVMDMVRKEFNVDDKRIYLLGHSMGGAGTLFLGAKYPSNWAAIASIAPAAFMMQKDQKNYLSQIKNANIPAMIVQGGKDNVVPPQNTRTWADAMKELGMKYEYVELPEGDHGTVIAEGMPNIFKFFAAHSKGSVP